MELIEQHLVTFSPKDFTDFKKQHESTSQSKLELRLFELLAEQSGESHEQLSSRLYGAPNLGGYYNVRKRLYKKIIQYIRSIEVIEDTTFNGLVLEYLILANRMIRYKNAAATLYYLKLAEKKARSNGQLAMLDQILFLMVKHADWLKLPLSPILEKWEKNAKALATFRKLEITLSRVRIALDESKLSGIPMDADKVIADVFAQFKITAKVETNPLFMLRLASIVRSAYISVKDYKRIEPFIEKSYNCLKKAGAFTEFHRHCEFEFTLMLAHTYYRNFKFKEAQALIGQMEILMQQDKSVAVGHLQRFISLRAGIASYSGDNISAIIQIEKALKGKVARLDPSEHQNMVLNLAVYYFNAKQFKESNNMLYQLPGDEELQSSKGGEWILKKNLIEMIVQYELGNKDIALSTLRRIKKVHARLMKQPLHYLTPAFLKFTAKLIADRHIVNNPSFLSEIQAVLKSAPDKREDIQAVSFLSWLKSKILHRDYHELLVERVNR